MSIQELKPVKEGKVREVYDNGDSMVIVATDRISAFDVILKNEITQKGAILTQMSKFWFEFTKDIVPNHMISTDVTQMPEFFHKEKFDGNSMKCKKLRMLPVECIVLQAVVGKAIRKMVQCVVLNYQKDCRNQSSFQSQFIPRPQKQILAFMMSISHLRTQWKFLKSFIQEKVLSTLRFLRIVRLSCIKNVQNMRETEELLLLIQSLNLA